MDLERERKRESRIFGHGFRARERELTFNQPVERERAWRIS